MRLFNSAQHPSAPLRYPIGIQALDLPFSRDDLLQSNGKYSLIEMGLPRIHLIFTLFPQLLDARPQRRRWDFQRCPLAPTSGKEEVRLQHGEIDD